MKSLTYLLALICSLFALCLLYLRYKKNERKKEEEKARIRKELFDFYKRQIDKIKTAVEQFKTFLSNDNGYFNNHKLDIWDEAYSSLLNDITGRAYENIGLTVDEVTTITMFLNYGKNSSGIRNEFNKNFIRDELNSYREFFTKIEKHGLDKEQQVAVVTDEDNNLVIAGAGSGKTTTIVGKVNYVIHKYKVLPSEILLISFTNKSASTLAQRINIEGVEAKTFHKFGRDVMCEVENKQPNTFDENQFKNLILKFFKELIKDQGYLQKVTRYFTEFLKPYKSQEEFKNQGEYFQYLKDQKFQTYKKVLGNGKTTMKMEVVKSIEECKIANYLLFNGVDYEYEWPYKFDTATKEYRQYKPDFTINPKSNTVYLEHFALNSKGEVPPFFADPNKEETLEEATKKYKDGIEWKRNLHKKHGTILLETYSYEVLQKKLEKRLEDQLNSVGIKLTPKSPEEIWKIISDVAEDEVKNLITLFQTFITLMKSNNYRMDDVISKNNSTKDKFLRERNSLFIEIISPIFEKYQNYLSERKEIDFSDMINKAADYINSGSFKKKFSYVIIDEFQDISIGRYQLIRAIKKTNPACKLFCVGDDWQSIYRFTGSDIAIFKDFENYFGCTAKSKIETTYRFNNPLIRLSSDFILKNPNQAKKVLKGNDRKSTYYKIAYSNTEDQDDTFTLQDICTEILENALGQEKEIFVLGRYSFDINRIKNEQGIFDIDAGTGEINYTQINEEGESETLSAQFLTVHKAKGLEADIIIVLNCNSGKYGFPTEMSDDAVLNLLLSEADQYENEEERRLFYVAMTRAKEMVYFVADSAFKSKFICELEVEDKDSSIKKCPKCITADLIKRSGSKNGRSWAFYGCSNYKYGCDYQEWI